MKHFLRVIINLLAYGIAIGSSASCAIISYLVLLHGRLTLWEPDPFILRVEVLLGIMGVIIHSWYFWRSLSKGEL